MFEECNNVSEIFNYKEKTEYSINSNSLNTSQETELSFIISMNISRRNEFKENVEENVEENHNLQNPDKIDFQIERNNHIISNYSINDSNLLASQSTTTTLDEVQKASNGFKIELVPVYKNKIRLKFDRVFPLLFNSFKKNLIDGKLIPKFLIKDFSKVYKLRNRKSAEICLNSTYENLLYECVFHNNDKAKKEYENIPDKDKENYTISLRELFKKVIQNKSISEIIKEIRDSHNGEEKVNLEKMLRRINELGENTEEILDKFFLKYFKDEFFKEM